MRDEELNATKRQEQAAILLGWYDIHARAMPWRTGPADIKAGLRPDPYRVWMSEIMLQQTTVAAVKDYFHRFTARWPDVHHLAAAEDGDVMAEWAGLGYYARARNLLKCARTVAQDFGGVFPDTYDALLKLPGVGPYTASAVASIAFNRPETVVDGNVERVMARVYDIHDPLPGSKPQLTDLARALTPQTRPGDYAQAVMDLGATICTPRNPACGICPWCDHCQARIAGTATQLPRKTPKKPKPIRYGIAYIARREDGAWLLERRPEKGLLGGMLGWPGTDWAETTPIDTPPLPAHWHEIPTTARHTFTHFHLDLTVKITQLPRDAAVKTGVFIEKHQFQPKSLPTVMRKAFDLARAALETHPKDA